MTKIILESSGHAGYASSTTRTKSLTTQGRACLLIGIAFYDHTVSTFKFDGVDLLLLANSGNYTSCSIYYLKSPELKTADLVLVQSSSGHINVGYYVFSKADLDDTFGTPVTHADADTHWTRSCNTRDADGMVIQGMNMSEPRTISPASGQTTRWSQFAAMSSYGATKASTGGSVAMNLSLSEVGNFAGCIVDVRYKLPSGSRGYVVMSKMREFFEDIKKGLIPPDELHNRYRGLKEQGLLTI